MSNRDIIRDYIEEILKQVKLFDAKERCFLSAYQIAVLLNRDYKQQIKGLGIPHNIGGKGEGEYNSLSQYIAGFLAQEIKNGYDKVAIEFFNRVGLEQFSFRDENKVLSEPSNDCFSMFKYIGS